MKVTKDKVENSQAFLTIEMEPAEVEKSLEQAYHYLVKKANIPGFRKGKAPRPILERYLGKESLLEDALNRLVPEAYEKALKDEAIKAFAQPQIEIVQTEPVVFKARVPLPPSIKLGDYHHIQVTPEPVKLTEEDINAAIEQLRHQHAVWEPVERPVRFGDLAILNIETELEGKPFINRKEVQYLVLKERPFLVSGFAEQLVEMKKNEEKEFKLSFPSEHPRPELAGKEVSFKVRVIEIKEERLPELNDEFAQKVGPDFKTLASLREQVSTSLRLRAEEKAKIDFEERVVEAAVNLSQVEFPPILVEEEIDRLLNQQLRYLQVGGSSLEEYLKRINKTEAELREELRLQATKGVTGSLVLGKITEEEKIEVSDSEINAEIENLTKNATEGKDKLQQSLNTPQARDSIKQMLITRKSIQRLVEIAKSSAMNAEVVKKEEQE